MTPVQIYFVQVLALAALSLLTGLAILIGRGFDILRNGRSLRYYEDFDGTSALTFVTRPTRQLANQFEYPVLFFTLAAIAIAVPVESPWLVGLGWCYVALRWGHALIHLTINRLYLRTPVFMAGNLVLLAMWIILGVAILA
ncbi:MAG: MAPEG family protein [Pseudomonadota bacterium]